MFLNYYFNLKKQWHKKNYWFSYLRSKLIFSIDNICGDTWCEGDYDFKFNQFACNKKSSECELTFQFIERSDDKTVKEDLYSEKQVCHFDNIKSFDQLMDGEFSLNQDFYDQVSNCISEREASVTF